MPASNLPIQIPVVLTRCDRYQKREIGDFLDVCAYQLGLRDSYAGHTVLLKPNLISGRAPRLATTNPVLIAAVAEWFRDRGAGLRLGDSPAFGTAADVLRRHRIMEHIGHLDIEIVEFVTPRQRLLSHGVKIGVSEEALDCDLFVNLPKIKAHNQMYVTMGVKNLFGIVVGMRKGMAHMKNGLSHQRFGDLMLDLMGLLTTSCTIADGIEVMHKSGPVGGESLEFNCMAASRQPLALDTALMAALELTLERSPIHVAAQARRLPGSESDTITYPLAAPRAFFGSGFRAPAHLNPVVFNPLRFTISSMRRLLARRTTSP